MTNLHSIAAKKDEAGDKLAAKIAELRELFEPTYRPKFRVGDIVRFRKCVASRKLDKQASEYLLIVVRVRTDTPEESNRWRGAAPDDDVYVTFVRFVKEEQRDALVGVPLASWELELVEAYRDPSEGT